MLPRPFLMADRPIMHRLTPFGLQYLQPNREDECLPQNPKFPRFLSLHDPVTDAAHQPRESGFNSAELSEYRFWIAAQFCRSHEALFYALGESCPWNCNAFPTYFTPTAGVLAYLPTPSALSMASLPTVETTYFTPSGVVRTSPVGASCLWCPKPASNFAVFSEWHG
jgi:hypothetical protein